MCVIGCPRKIQGKRSLDHSRIESFSRSVFFNIDTEVSMWFNDGKINLPESKEILDHMMKPIGSGHLAIFS